MTRRSGSGRCATPPYPATAASQAEAEFLAIGDGAQRWLAEAAARGAARIRSKMARADELAAVVGADKVEAALGLAAVAGRFADGDLASIIDHLAAERETVGVVRAEAHSAQPGTFAGPAGTFRQRTEIAEAQHGILDRLAISLPPKIYQLAPATPR